jgi:hypothetical protein
MQQQFTTMNPNKIQQLRIRLVDLVNPHSKNHTCTRLLCTLAILACYALQWLN